MKKSLLLASLIAAMALAACGKKEEPAVDAASVPEATSEVASEPAPAVEPAPVASEAAPAEAAEAASDAASAASN